MPEIESRHQEGEAEVETGEFKPLYRGVWADRLKNGQELPIGGTLFGTDLSRKLELDFDSFETGQFTEERMREAYEKSKDAVADWLKRCGSDIDPYTYFVCFNVQKKVESLLEVNPEIEDPVGRNEAYSEEKPPKISELKGKTACGERAALGQYLLQSCGLKSYYVGGVEMQDAKDPDEFATPHSYIVIEQDGNPEETLIFDIARPHIGQNKESIARILRTHVPFTYDLLKGKDNLLVAAEDVLQSQRLWFGAGAPVAGWHETIEKHEE